MPPPYIYSLRMRGEVTKSFWREFECKLVLCTRRTMASDKVQIVFMVDTSLPRTGSLEQHYRSLCLATVRMLLYLSQFPIRQHLNRVLWNFKLFNSERAEKSFRRGSSTRIALSTLTDFFSSFTKVWSSQKVLQHNQAMPDSLMSRIRHKNLSDLYTVHLQLSFKILYGTPQKLYRQLG